MTRSQRCKPGWTPEEMAVGQDADRDIGGKIMGDGRGDDRYQKRRLDRETEGSSSEKMGRVDRVPGQRCNRHRSNK